MEDAITRTHRLPYGLPSNGVTSHSPTSETLRGHMRRQWVGTKIQPVSSKTDTAHPQAGLLEPQPLFRLEHDQLA
ncbi:MAG: hypothetical protein RBS27_08485, partial [Giesbergeria sp.]|nr:hypothetical protein [Giesbergeria sp.]